jgi:hypothetical protein
MPGDHSVTSLAPPWSRPADGLGEAPPLPVRRAPGCWAQSRPGDLNPEELAGVRDDEVPDPRRQGWPTPGHGVLDPERLLERTPLGVREPDEDALLAGVRQRRAPADGHGISVG